MKRYTSKKYEYLRKLNRGRMSEKLTGVQVLSDEAVLKKYQKN